MALENLTAEERKALLAELEEQQKEEKKKVEQERKAYKDLVNETIPQLCEQLRDVSLGLGRVKSIVYAEMQKLVEIKQQVYNREDDQFTHSFSTDDGVWGLTIGYRVNDGWDDTVHVGIAKVKAYVSALGRDKETQALVELVLKLLSKDSKGNLKASRVLQLKKLADDTENADFIDAIKIISDAYRPAKTKQFVSLRFENKDVPLNITDVEVV